MAQDQPIVFTGDSEPGTSAQFCLRMKAPFYYLKTQIYSFIQERTIELYLVQALCQQIFGYLKGLNKRLDLDSESIHSAVGFLNQNQSFVYASLTKQGAGYETQLMIADWQDGDLDNSKKFEIKYFNNKSAYFSAAFSRDGKHMVMSMEANVTMGVEDLYVSHVQENGDWSPPMTLGYGINTRAQEMTPFLAHDNETLFFATNGREGWGSFDIYYAKRLDDTWQKWSDPVNLGSKINTSGAEKSFSFSDVACRGLLYFQYQK